MEFRRVLFRSAKTLEVLESLGVPVIGYGCDELPAFYSRSSGLAAPLRRDSAAGIAAVMAAKWDLELGGGLVIANPIPAEAEIPAQKIAAHIATAPAAEIGRASWRERECQYV